LSSLLLELDSVSLELDSSSAELLLDCGVTSEEDDSATLDEDSTTLLLDSSLALRMTDEELLDFTELDESSFFEDEDFAFSLLLDRSSTGAEDDDRTELLDCSVTLEEDDSTPGSSFCPADAEELSSHPTTANATKPIATRNFFISASKQYLSKENVIYFHPKKAKQAQSIDTKAARISQSTENLSAQVKR
jgi:hypothetical protein